MAYDALLDADYEFEIPVEITDGPRVYDAVITNLIDDDGHITWRPERARIAIGWYLTGPRAGQCLIIEDIEPHEIKTYVH